MWMVRMYHKISPTMLSLTIFPHIYKSKSIRCIDLLKCNGNLHKYYNVFHICDIHIHNIYIHKTHFTILHVECNAFDKTFSHFSLYLKNEKSNYMAHRKV